MVALLVMSVTLHIITLSAVVVYAALRLRFVVDVQRVADIFAADMLNQFSPDELNEDGTKREIRQRYQRLVTTFGLPSTAADAVVSRTWQRIQQAGGQAGSPVVRALYE